MEKIIVTDCDGCLLAWETAFHAWMEYREFELLKTEPRNTYHFEDSFGISRDKGKELVQYFNESAAIGFLEPFRDAVEGVRKLVSQGYKFDVVTSLGEYEPSVKLREWNLKQIFGEDAFRNIVCIGLGEDKYDYLKEHYGDSGLYWIEDKPANARDGAMVGMKAIMIEHLHNKNYKSDYTIRRARNWDEIVRIIEQDA